MSSSQFIFFLSVLQPNQRGMWAALELTYPNRTGADLRCGRHPLTHRGAVSHEHEVITFDLSGRWGKWKGEWGTMGKSCFVCQFQGSNCAILNGKKGVSFHLVHVVHLNSSTSVLVPLDASSDRDTVDQEEEPVVSFPSLFLGLRR